MIDLETDLLPLLGAREGAGTRGRLEFLAGESADLAEYPGKQYWVFTRTGLEALLAEGRLVAFFAHMIPPAGWAAFRGTLRAGIALPRDQAGVRAALGSPTEFGTPQPIHCDYFYFPEHVIGMTRPWDRYRYSTHVLLCEYVGESDLRVSFFYMSDPGYVPTPYPDDGDD